MTDFIKKYNIGFTQVPNWVLNATDISLKAKGLYAYLFSKPDGWQFHFSVIKNDIKESRGQFLSIMKELIDNGYITRTQFNKNGKFGGMIYEFVNKDHIRKEPYVEKCEYGKTGIHNNIDNINNTDILNNTNILENNKTINSFIICDPNENCSQVCQNGSVCSRPAVFNFNGQSYCGQHFRIALDNIIKNLGGTSEIKIKESKSGFTPPTIDECKAYAREIHCWKELGEDVYNFYSMNNWRDTRGKPIKNWKLKMYQWYMHDKEKYKDYSDMPCYQEQKDEDFVRAKPLRTIE